MHVLQLVVAEHTGVGLSGHEVLEVEVVEDDGTFQRVERNREIPEPVGMAEVEISQHVLSALHLVVQLL